MAAPLKTFIIYAHEDLTFKTSLEKHLRHLVKSKKIELWSDREIKAGEVWDESIKLNLSEAEVILMLVSSDFYASDYIQDQEFTRAKEKFDKNEALLIPIIVRPCSWKSYDLIKNLQALPVDAKPVALWHSHDEAFTFISEEIEILTDKLILSKEQINKGSKSAHVVPKNTTISNLKKIEPQNGQSFQDFPEAPEVVFVKGGNFKMGSNIEDQERPIHNSAVSNFWIGKYPITFEEFDFFCKDTKRKMPDDGNWGRRYRPVINVTFEDVNLYCLWLKNKTGRPYRLPTESEWEYAAKGGILSKSNKFSGDNDIEAVGWYKKNSGNKTMPVGQKKCNELGLFDMSGNVWEWCSDWYSPYILVPPIDYTGAVSGTKKVNRGGGWISESHFCRITYRTGWDPKNKDNNLGFRIALSHDEKSDYGLLQSPILPI